MAVTVNLAAALSSGATTVAVDNTNQLPPVPFALTIDNETLVITAISATATTLTATRGASGSSAAAHVVNSVGTVVGFGGGTASYPGALTVTGNATLQGTETVAPGIIRSGTTQPVISSLNAHVSGATCVGNDTAGIITYTTDGSGVAQNQTLFVVTYANTALYATTAIVPLTNITAGAASTTLHAGGYGAVSAGPTAFSVVVTGAALTASGTFKVTYGPVIG